MRPALRPSVALLVGASIALALPVAASSQVNVPPGNSEADQYFETVPNGSGDSSPDPTRPPEDVLSPGQIAELEELGADGRAAAALAAATAPDGTGKSGGNGNSGNGQNGDGGPVDAGGHAATGTRSSSGASTSTPSREGLGGLLWLIIIGGGLAALGFAAMRRRTPGTA